MKRPDRCLKGAHSAPALLPTSSVEGLSSMQCLGDPGPSLVFLLVVLYSVFCRRGRRGDGVDPCLLTLSPCSLLTTTVTRPFRLPEELRHGSLDTSKGGNSLVASSATHPIELVPTCVCRTFPSSQESIAGFALSCVLNPVSLESFPNPLPYYTAFS